MTDDPDGEDDWISLVPDAPVPVARPRVVPCRRCGAVLPDDLTVCPACHSSVDGGPASGARTDGQELRLVFRSVGRHLGLRRGEEVTLGRSTTWAPDAATFLADETTVSGRHARVHHAGDGTAWITEVEQGATNGTRVNGRVLVPGAREQLRDGDTVHLGPRVSFLVRGGAAPTG
ncbi:FHA domain-containing protein [Streptomyces sp. NPDC060198]|uniref:FHA domain-containing protein n=1 Tax=Streptomyces sp. NPDC060198 TaxID=3347070 RepID=UPI0036620E3F